MLINALCGYYDILASQGKVLPEGYSKVGIDFLVSLTPEGKIDDIVDLRERDVKIYLPKRTEKPGIDANIIEHRATYIFGLNYENDGENPALTTKDKTSKAEKSHDVFVQKNLEFIDSMDSPVVNAYRSFIMNWNPSDETENPYILSIGKGLGMAKFAFCLAGHPEILLHEDAAVKEKWESIYKQSLAPGENDVIAQCAISGEKERIAQLHNKISGLPGGQAMGNLLVCFNNDSDNSYGKEQAINSNISYQVMMKYTEALNSLVKDKHHRTIIDDVTVLYWAMTTNDVASELMSSLFFGESDTIDAEQTESVLSSLMEDVNEGNITAGRLLAEEKIDPSVDFYIVGLKPNSSRIALKFLHRKKYGELLNNVVLHQYDIKISADSKPVSLWQIKREMISPKSKNDSVNPAILAKIFESIIYARPYPDTLLATIVRRVKTDSDTKINQVRAGIIKACINRKTRQLNNKEELKMALDTENNNQAYLCGRLFAVLEKLQQEASGGSLNRTIKDSYFASASSKPAMVFPILMRLAQNHLKKADRETFFNKLIEEIIGKLNDEFPENLLLSDQGRFIIGYYQQYQNFFVKNEKTTEDE
jgi:CRISPR-associated protein Csd1